MKFKFAIEGDLKALMTREVLSGQRAVSSAMGQAAGLIKEGWRAQVTGSGLGARLAKTVRSATYPKGAASLNAAALVWSKAPEIMFANEKGATIRSADGFWLAIPTPAAGTGPGGRRLTPGEWEKKRGLRLRFVFRPGRPGLLVADGRQNSKGLGVKSGSKTGRGMATVPIFILVPQVRLRKRLNVAELGQSVASRLPALVVANWED
jgi:hypothetical protein